MEKTASAPGSVNVGDKAAGELTEAVQLAAGRI
jgi:hypothetical protein